jgi:hypothetical protein
MLSRTFMDASSRARDESGRSITADENYAPQSERPCTPAEWFLAVAGEDYAEARALSAFEAAVLEECINGVNSAEFLADLLVLEPGKPDPRICTEASLVACGFDRFLHGTH